MRCPPLCVRELPGSRGAQTVQPCNGCTWNGTAMFLHPFNYEPGPGNKIYQTERSNAAQFFSGKDGYEPTADMVIAASLSSQGSIFFEGGNLLPTLADEGLGGTPPWRETILEATAGVSWAVGEHKRTEGGTSTPPATPPRFEIPLIFDFAA